MQATGELVAGRELDALIATRVMGMAVCDTPSDSQLPIKCGLYGVEPHFAPDDWGLPEYSTDIAAAWQVVEHVRENSIGVLRIVGLIRGYRVAFSDTRWSTATDDEDLDGTYYVREGVGETLPLAICRAALAFSGG